MTAKFGLNSAEILNLDSTFAYNNLKANNLISKRTSDRKLSLLFTKTFDEKPKNPNHLLLYSSLSISYLIIHSNSGVTIYSSKSRIFISHFKMLEPS